MKHINLFVLIFVGFLFAGSIYSAYEFKSSQVGTSAAKGDVLQTDGTSSTWVATSTLGITATETYTGTVTSVAMTVPTGLTISGSPITTAGTLAITLTAGYDFWTDTKWDVRFAATNTDALTEGSVNKYMTQNSWDVFMTGTTTLPKITTLANLSITSANISDMANYWDNRFNSTTTDALTEGTSNFYFTDNRADVWITATTTLPKITTLSNLSITESQISDLQTYLTTIGSGSNGQLAYWGGTNLLFGVATGTISSSGGVTVTADRSAIGGSLAITCTAADTNNTGCLSDTDWDTFNGKIDNTVATLSSLASIGTITTGTWQATPISTTYGGTGLGAGGLKSTFIPYGNGTSAFSTSTSLYFTATTNNLYAKYSSSTAQTATQGIFLGSNAAYVSGTTTMGGFDIASTTLVRGLKFNAGTTTGILGGMPTATTITSAWCEATSTAATTAYALIQVFDQTGNYTNTLRVTTTGARFLINSNNTFTADEPRYYTASSTFGTIDRVFCRFSGYQTSP